MRVLVFGLGAHGGGFAAAEYFLNRGDEVRVTDLRGSDALGEAITILEHHGAVCITGEHRKEDFLWADLIVKNPAISPDNSYLRDNKAVITDFSWLFASPWCAETNIIAITGTKGKTTTAAAVAHVLNATGQEAVQCGNMGISAFTILTDWEKRKARHMALPKYLVCELSSWQIRDLYSTLRGELPDFSVATLTSLYADHQNSYKDMAAYYQDKFELFGSHCKEILVSDELVDVFRKNLPLPAKKIHGIHQLSGRVMSDSSPLRAAYGICKLLGMKGKDILKALETFHGVPHRLEHVGIAGKIMFINDSAATIPEAVLFSFQNCRPAPVHLICGGTDKNLDAHGMLDALKEAASLHLLDGSFTRNKIIPLLEQEKIPYCGPFITMDEAVDSAYETATSNPLANNDNVQMIMLSPGAASFEYFKHEFDRGDKFRTRSIQKIADFGSQDGGADDSASAPHS